MMRRFAGVSLSLLVASGAIAQDASRPDTISTTAEVSQSAAVKARFADIPIALKAPSLAPGRESFTTQEEMTSFIAELAQRNPRMKQLSAGKSGQGRDIPVLLFTAEGKANFREAAALGRPVLWFIGFQHGNEPAGGEGVLAFAAYLATPEAGALLDKVTVAIAPRANPDGAAAFRRDTASRADSNRDHLLHFLPETRALHDAMAQLPPDVVFDHHEFSVVNRWIEKFGSIQAVDAMVLHATNPMVPREISSLAEDLFRPAVETALKQHGLSMFWYYTTSNRLSDRVVSMGGNNPGIARNAFGLRGAVSFLIETRGVGVKREGWQRRVATHVIAAKAVLESAASQAERLRTGLAAGRLAAARADADLVVAAKIPPKPLVVPLMDPDTGADRPTEVAFQDSRVIEPTSLRSRAGGFLITAETAGMLERFGRLGVAACRLNAPAELEVRAYRIDSFKPPTDRETINPDQALKATAEMRRKTFEAGTVFVPMAQVSAGIVAATLEPDTAGSYVSAGVIPLAEGAIEAPVYAVARGAALPLSPISDAARASCSP